MVDAKGKYIFVFSWLYDTENKSASKKAMKGVSMD